MFTMGRVTTAPRPPPAKLVFCGEPRRMADRVGVRTARRALAASISASRALIAFTTYGCVQQRMRHTSSRCGTVGDASGRTNIKTGRDT